MAVGGLGVPPVKPAVVLIDLHRRCPRLPPESVLI